MSKVLIDRQVIEQALEAFELYYATEDIPYSKCEAAITALRSALESAESVEQEPVAFGKSDSIRHLAENIMTDCGVASTYDSLREKIENRLWDYFDTHPAPAVPEVEKYREALEMARDAMKVAITLLNDYTDACGSEYTGPYLSMDGQFQVMEVREALAKIEEVLK